MKRTIPLVMVLLSCYFALSQSPATIPYQAVARNAAGNLLQNQNICLQFTIHKLTAGGSIEYQEHQAVTTNKLGLFNVNVGSGIYDGGSISDFSGISWGGGAKYMEVGINTSGTCSGYTSMGASQMMSVPFALYANTAGSAPGDNWGTQTAATSAPITGNGSSGNPLSCPTCLTTGSLSGLGSASATIGLTAVPGGSTTTGMYANSAPALSQAIVPTWTGTHTFSNATYSALFTGGDVGIGTSSPVYKLEVLGGAVATDNYFFNINTGIGQIVLNSQGTYYGNISNPISQAWSLGYSSGGTSLGTSVLTWNASGNVGIGTNTPAAPLDVYGANFDMNSRSVAQDDGDGWLRLNQNAAYVNGIYTPGFLRADGGVTSGPAAGLGTGTINATSSATIGGNVTINGASSATGNIAFGAANPYITASSYTVMPGGLYCSSGTHYDQTQYQCRGGIHNDNAAYLTIAGGTSGVSYFTGNVGIGTTNPTHGMLEINGSITKTPAVEWRGVYSSGLCTIGGVCDWSNRNISIYTSDDIWVGGGQVFMVSDQRIKKDFNLSDNLRDLETLERLSVTDYKFINSVERGGDTKKGFIAQQVERVFPEAVTYNSEFIPDVYALPVAKTLNANTLTVTTKLIHGFCTGDEVRLITPIGKKEVTVKVKDDYTFEIAQWNDTSTDLFIYGKKVDDFHSVDYDRIYTLNVSATQELAKQVEQLKAENERLNRETEAMKEETNNIKCALASSEIMSLPGQVRQQQALIEELKQLILKAGGRSETEK